MIKLEPYRPEAVGGQHFLLDRQSGSYRTAVDQPGALLTDSAGYGDERTVGLFRRRIVFAAIYLLDDVVEVLINGVTWRAPVAVQRQTVFPYIKKLSVGSGAQAMDVTFWYDDHAGFPGTPATDIFWFIAHNATDAEAVERFKYIQRAGQAGRKVDQQLLDEASSHARRTVSRS